ncbi:MAG: transcriptional regulator, partial [Dehalococcoidia bacterium]
GGPGRPKYAFHLTQAGEACFPRMYSDLTNELLEYVESEDPELVGRIFERRSRRRLEMARERLRGKAFADRLAELTRQLDEDGYLADVQKRPDGSYVITEHNCAVLGVAQRYGHACASEIDFLRAALPDAEIERTSHIVSGAFACTYAIRPRPA